MFASKPYEAEENITEFKKEERLKVYVNPIAIGVLFTLVGEIAIAILYGMIHSLIARDEEEELELAPEVKAELRKEINSVLNERESDKEREK